MIFDSNTLMPEVCWQKLPCTFRQKNCYTRSLASKKVFPIILNVLTENMFILFRWFFNSKAYRFPRTNLIFLIVLCLFFSGRPSVDVIFKSLTYDNVFKIKLSFSGIFSALKYKIYRDDIPATTWRWRWDKKCEWTRFFFSLIIWWPRAFSYFF